MFYKKTILEILENFRILEFSKNSRNSRKPNFKINYVDGKVLGKSLFTVDDKSNHPNRCA